MATGAEPSMLDVFARRLAEGRRRFDPSALLDGSGGSATFEELVDVIVDADTSSPAPDRESVATTLHHAHRPSLAEGGLLKYERDEGVVSTASRTEPIRPFVGVIRSVGESAVVT